MSCKTNSDKIRILSSCSKPVYTNVCNTDALATAIANAVGTGGGSATTVDTEWVVLYDTVLDGGQQPFLRKFENGVQVGDFELDGATVHTRLNNGADFADIRRTDHVSMFTGRVVRDASGKIQYHLKEVRERSWTTPAGFSNNYVFVYDLDNNTNYLLQTGEELVDLSTLTNNADNYKQYVTQQTITGASIVVTFFEGTGVIRLNGGTDIDLDSNRQYRTEPMDGTVIINPDTGGKYHVSWRA